MPTQWTVLRRSVFGAPLSKNPLHLQTLAEMELQFRACLHFTVDAIALQARMHPLLLSLLRFLSV